MDDQKENIFDSINMYVKFFQLIVYYDNMYDIIKIFEFYVVINKDIF